MSDRLARRVASTIVVCGAIRATGDPWGAQVADAIESGDVTGARRMAWAMQEGCRRLFEPVSDWLGDHVSERRGWRAVAVEWGRVGDAIRATRGYQREPDAIPAMVREAMELVGVGPREASPPAPAP